MNFKKIIGLVTALVMLVSLCQFSFAAESSSTEILIGDNQYLDLGADLNGLVGVSSTDDNPVPSDAKYTNGLYLQGAQVRTPSDEADSGELGLRFIIVNNTDMTAKMEAAELTDIVYGALVQEDKGILLNFNNATTVTAKKIFKTSTQLGMDYQKYTACVTNIPEESLRSGIAVRPFVKYKDLDNVERVLYGEQYSCDTYITALDAYNSGNETDATETALYDNILSKFAGEDENGNEIFPQSNEFAISKDDAYIQKWRDKTDSKITKIRYTGNMTIPSTATVYYVSNSGDDDNDGKTPQTAWATLTEVNDATLKSGDYVLFERGGTWRGLLKAKAGVTYSAYGEGAKPIICGSPEDGADSSKWTKQFGTNIWVYEKSFGQDVGSIVFRDSQGNESYATKWIVLKDSSGTLKEVKSGASWSSYKSLTGDLNFWHNNVYSGDNKIYLYSTSNPGTRFESIEFLRQQHGIDVKGDNVTIDNICVKYVGAHGVSAGGIRKNLKVTNCEFGWIGGSIQWINIGDTLPHTVGRYGNGVEIYGGCNGFTVENCYFYQIYDAAVTHQIGMSEADDYTDTGHYNVTFSDNVMEYCTYSIEYWWKHWPTDEEGNDAINKPVENPSYMGNILYENNLMWYCGEGLGSQRPNNEQAAHIKGWTHKNYVNNFVLRNNFMAFSTYKLMDSNFNYYLMDWTKRGVTVENNILIGEYGQNFGKFGISSGNKTDITYVYNMESSDKFLRDIKKADLIGNKYYFVVE